MQFLKVLARKVVVPIGQADAKSLDPIQTILPDAGLRFVGWFLENGVGEENEVPLGQHRDFGREPRFAVLGGRRSAQGAHGQQDDQPLN